jgi:hypothetical protein
MLRNEERQLNMRDKLQSKCPCTLRKLS